MAFNRPKLQNIISRPRIPTLLPLLLAVLAFAVTMLQYLRIVVGDSTMFFDAQQVWQPLAQSVASGTELYLPGAADNKPPLFQYLNLAVYYTGAYKLVFYLLIGVVNATIVILLYEYAGNNYNPQVAFVAALFFVAALPIVDGDYINVRSLALVPLLYAAVNHRPVRRGVGVAIAGLFCQYAVFALPVLAYDGLRRTTRPYRWGSLFAAAGLVTVGLSFLPLYVFWGVDSLYFGIESSFFSISEYTARNDQFSLAASPLDWLGLIASITSQLAYILLPAVLAVATSWWGADFTYKQRLHAALAIALVLPLFVKALRYYWLLPLPFLSLLAAQYLDGLTVQKT